MRLGRLACILLAVVWAAGVVAAGVRPAVAAPYAAIVMDMRNGEVVHAEGADRQQHPASLTKLMTLYLTFEALRSGQVRLDQKVRVSRNASRQPPSKLYLRAGQRVTIRHLIRAAAIRSANDAAMVLAETIGGSEKAFARLMTNKARELGMSQTTFKNPHGLTQSGHLSTARDMALLARHLLFDFPEYYNVFGRKTAYAAGKRVHTTNRLLSTYQGAEGLKTGYTRAAGYNLAATAKRGERRVLAVVMGGKSSAWRNARVAKLLDQGFREVPARVAEVAPRARAIRVADAPVPPRRPGVPATGLAAIGQAFASPAAAALPEPGEHIFDTAPATKHAPASAEHPLPRPGLEPQRHASAGSAVPAAAINGDWAVQLGAFRDKAAAVASLNAVSLADLPMLRGGRSVIDTSRAKSGRPIYKVRYTGLDEARARAACNVVKRSGGDCLPMAPR